MIEQWTNKKLGDICDIKTGSSNTVDADENGKYTFFDRSKKIKKSNKYLFDCEALIIPGEGAQFFPRYFSGKFDLHQRVYSIKNFIEEIYIRYVEYFLIYNHKHFEQVAVGATVKSLRLRHFTEIQLSYPSLEEQKQIVAKLDEAFAEIDTAKLNVEKNLENAKELFQSKLSEIFSQKGEGWVEKKLGDIAQDFGRGKSKHRPRNDPALLGGDFPFVQTGDVRNSKKMITSHSNTYNEFGLAQSKLWDKGTVCITIAANIAETAILDFSGCFPDSIIGFVADENTTSNFYVYYLLQYYKSELQMLSKGSAQDNINLGTFQEKLFPFPALNEQNNIVNELNKFEQQTQSIESKYQQELNSLEELKKSILEKALNGEL
jgi:type I restriction enzyme, S subunit